MSSTSRPRTTKYYDDREGDVITTLETPLIKVTRGPAPRTAYFVVPQERTQPNDQASIDLHVECYVRLNALSEDLRRSIRVELGLAPHVVPRPSN
jgi:hypothetical protein